MSDVLLAKLNHPRFVEAISYLPKGKTVEADRLTLNARVIRDQAPFLHGNRESVVNYAARIQVLSYAHATHSGIVTPEIGMRFKLAPVRGGTAVDGWSLESIQGHDAYWELSVRYMPIENIGGNQLERGAN